MQNEAVCSSTLASGHKILISRAIWPIGAAAAAAAEARIELQINCRRAAKSYLTCRAAAVQQLMNTIQYIRIADAKVR
jgi:hypothetical protein